MTTLRAQLRLAIIALALNDGWRRLAGTHDDWLGRGGPLATILGFDSGRISPAARWLRLWAVGTASS